MQLFRLTKAGALAFALSLPIWAGPIATQQPDKKTEPDNTEVNKRDRKSESQTADQQKMNSADRDLSAKVRRSIMDDKDLSTYAHNVKVISRDGTITLKGPVRSNDEVKSIMAKATDIAGTADKVVNQMTVKPASKP